MPKTKRPLPFGLCFLLSIFDLLLYDPAMTIKAIQEAVHQTPFRPFNLHITDGRTVEVPHPDYIAFAPTGQTITIYAEDDVPRIFDVALLTELAPIKS